MANSTPKKATAILELEEQDIGFALGNESKRKVAFLLGLLRTRQSAPEVRLLRIGWNNSVPMIRPDKRMVVTAKRL